MVSIEALRTTSIMNDQLLASPNPIKKIPSKQQRLARVLPATSPQLGGKSHARRKHRSCNANLWTNSWCWACIDDWQANSGTAFCKKCSLVYIRSFCAPKLSCAARQSAMKDGFWWGASKCTKDRNWSSTAVWCMRAPWASTSNRLSSAQPVEGSKWGVHRFVGWLVCYMLKCCENGSIVEKENGKTLKHCCSKSSLHAFGLSIIGHAWIPWFAQGFSKETNHCKNILRIACLSLC